MRTPTLLPWVTHPKTPQAVNVLDKAPRHPLSPSPNPTLEQFVLPLGAFDATLLPPEARDPRSPAFRTALDDCLRQQFRLLGANRVVQITGETLSVDWITRGFQPMDAAIALCQRGQVL
jgi:hypothetical protein